MIFLMELNSVDAVALGKKIAPDNDMGILIEITIPPVTASAQKNTNC